MTCDRCRSLVDEYVDDTLTVDERRAVEAHLADCAACRSIAADVGAIRAAARTLDRLAPPPRVWSNISAALAARPRGAWWRPATSWTPLAAAAALLLVAGLTTWLMVREVPSVAPAARTRSAPAATAANTELVQSVETELKLAEEHYQKAIAGLEQITRTESAALDPQVAAVIQKNLDVIDHAIGESRAALQSQPASQVAQESLFEALRNKVALLQDTVVLINEMRKGNPEGTARAVSGLNQ
jgi:anti-sigma factor RsiW